MHKTGKWARALMELQDAEGKWGYFHTLSQMSNRPITTEQALRRLERLGCTMSDRCIQNAVAYMDSCLTGKREIPDAREKIHDWDLFTSMILATWIRRFTPDNPNANAVAAQWASVVTYAFRSGTYRHTDYLDAYRKMWGMKPQGGRFLDFVSFYQISLLKDCLDVHTEAAMLDYILEKDDGIYYVYDQKLSVLPACFASKTASRYLGAIELLASYQIGREKLGFVADWLMENRQENGNWDMGKEVNDKLYFPLSDDWRKKENREEDSTERILALLKQIHP